jgi:nitroreductase
MSPTKSKPTRARTIVENRGPKRTREATSTATASLSSLFANTINDDDDLSTLKSTSALSTSKEAHALEVFERHASDGAYEGQKFIAEPESLLGVLVSLDLDATLEDADIVFRFLDTDGDGRLLFKDEFLPWYLDAVQQAAEISRVFQSMLVGRRTVEEFDKTPVDDAILERAVQCAMAAPNRSCSEPWRFLSVGPSTVEKLAVLNADRTTADAEKGKFTRFTDWNSVAPGWCVVTTQKDNTKEDNDIDSTNDEYLMSAMEQEDYKSVCCSVQNFMLSMWSEGIGTKWTTGPVQMTHEFADICGIDRSKERVVGIIWYGYATGGAKYADPRRRKLSVDDVLGYLP